VFLNSSLAATSPPPLSLSKHIMGEGQNIIYETSILNNSFSDVMF
jgi:hypothetical protein